MTTSEPAAAAEQQAIQRERFRLVERIEHLLAAPATFLAVVFVMALAAELVLTAQGQPVPALLAWTQTAIWVIFGIQFGLGILISPDRWRYLRRHWITAASLLLPFLRIFRVLRAAGAIRAFSGVRALTAFNRGARSITDLVAWSRAGYPLALAGLASVIGSATLFLFEANEPDSPLNTYGEAVWWTLSTLTTVGHPSTPQSIGGRAVGLLIMLSGLVILGYVAGVVGALLFDRGRGASRPTRRRTD